MVVASWRLMATRRFSSLLEYSCPRLLHRPMMPTGLSLPQNKIQIQERSASERRNSATFGGKCGKYSAVTTSVRERITRSPKPSVKEISAVRILSRLRGPQAARRRYVVVSESDK